MTQLTAWVVNNKAVKRSLRIAEYKIEGPHSRALAKPTRDKDGIVSRQSAEKWYADIHKNNTNAMSGTQIQKAMDNAAIAL